MPCNRCGICCKAIPLRFTKADIKANPLYKTDLDMQFVVDYWQRISKAKAYAINPHLKTVENLGYDKYYTCRLLKDATCLINYDKPNICKNYPFYNHEPSTDLFISPDCGYSVEVEEYLKEKK